MNRDEMIGLVATLNAGLRRNNAVLTGVAITFATESEMAPLWLRFDWERNGCCVHSDIPAREFDVRLFLLRSVGDAVFLLRSNADAAYKTPPFPTDVDYGTAEILLFGGTAHGVPREEVVKSNRVIEPKPRELIEPKKPLEPKPPSMNAELMKCVHDDFVRVLNVRDAQVTVDQIKPHSSVYGVTWRGPKWVLLITVHHPEMISRLEYVIGENDGRLADGTIARTAREVIARALLDRRNEQK